MAEADGGQPGRPTSDDDNSASGDHPDERLKFEERRRIAFIGVGLTIAFFVGLGSIIQLVSGNGDWGDRTQSAIVVIICVPALIWLLKLLDGEEAHFVVRMIASAPSVTQAQRLAVLVTNYLGSAIFTVGVLLASYVVLAAAGDTRVPVAVPFAAMGCVLVGGSLRGWTRRQGVTIEAQIAGLQRKFSEAENTVKKSKSALTETQTALASISSELRRQAQRLQMQHAENEQFVRELRADPEAAKAYLKAQAIGRRRGNLFAIGLFVLGILAGYVVNLTTGGVGHWIHTVFH